MPLDNRDAQSGAPRTAGRQSIKPWIATALSAACAAALWAAAGCESAVQRDAFENNWTNYASSVLNRGIADGSLNELPVDTKPVNQGVHEYARVDSPGPNGTAAIMPAGSPTPGVPEVAASQASTQGGPGDPATFGGLDEPVVNLSLEEAITRALHHSLAIKVEAYNPGIREAQITEAIAAFDPVLFGQSQWSLVDEPNVTTASFSHETTFQNTVGIKKSLASGGTIQATTGDNYQDIQNTTLPVSPDPSHTADIGLALSQPLLRGFGESYNRASIYLAQRDSRIALNVFRRQVITSLDDVEEAYLALVQARAIVDIQIRLLQATKETYAQVQQRLNIDATEVNVAQTKAALESRNADLIRARTNVRNASDKLKALINDPALDLRGNLLINPTDKPVAEPISLNVAEQLDIALRQRGEMQEARLTIEKADIVLDVAKNDLLPKFDLTMSTQATALSKDFASAFANTIDANKYMDFGAGLKFEIPLGNRQAEAVVKRRNLERRQALTTMLQQAQKIILDVRTELREMLTTYQEVQARVSSRKAAGDELLAIQARQEVGERLTPEFLQLRLDAQQRRANAELEELQSMINYNVAIVRLEVSKGTLLEYNRVSLSPPPADPDAGRVRFLGETKGPRK